MTRADKLYFAFAVHDDGRGTAVRCPDLRTAARERDRLRRRLPAHLGVTKTPAAEAVVRAWLNVLGAELVDVRDPAAAPTHS